MTELEKDIEAREYAEKDFGHNILLSASAGSGKSTTLVKRIAYRIGTDDDASVDRMLIVTFTRLAASELRKKIADKLSELSGDAVRKGDGKAAERFERQKLLISKADIGTLDMFCKDVVRKHFPEIGIEPNFDSDSFRVNQLRREIEEEVLEEIYGNKDSKEYKVIREIVEIICKFSDDEALKDKILDVILTYADNLPEPEEWIRGLADKYDVVDFWYEQVREKCDTLLCDGIEHVRECIKLVRSGEYVFKDTDEYLAALEDDAAKIEEQRTILNQKDGLFDMRLGEIEWSGMKSKPRKGKNNDERWREAHDVLAQNLYYRKKKSSTDKAESFNMSLLKLLPVSGETPEERRKNFESGIFKMKEFIKLLSDIALRVYRELQVRTREKNVYSFSQIEHFAYEILKNDSISQEYRKRYDEIYIDEYQDTNAVQEAIVTRISRLPEKQNMFMVGDVKQSIYEFRRATPEFFMRKYRLYKDLPDEGSLRVLGRNFRSRKEILDGTNAVFDSVMTEKTDGIEYKDGHELIYGAKETYGENPDTINSTHRCEFLMTPENEPDAVAARIMRLFDEKFEVGKGRKIEYGDICILARKNAELSTFRQRLSELGIPVTSGTTESLLETHEVENVLDFLRTVDNPHCDLPLAGLLTSEYYGFTAKNLAQIRLYGGKYKDFFDCVKAAASDNVPEGFENDPEMINVKEKANEFLNELELFRKQAEFLNVSRLLWEIINHRSFYGNCGEVQKKNLRKIVEISQRFDGGSAGGLYAFLKHIDSAIEKDNQGPSRTKTYTAAAVGDGDNAVKFLTVHKSKGLEFPVVFLVGTKPPKETEKAEKNNFFINEKYGIGFSFSEDASNKLNNSAPMCVLRADAVSTAHAENHRVLYVAMTRAVDKLIVTANVSEKSIPDMNLPRIIDKLTVDHSISEYSLLSCALTSKKARESWDFVSDALDPEQIEDGTAKSKFLSFVVEKAADNGNDDSGATAADGTNADNAVSEFLKLAEEITANDRRLPSKLSVSALKKMSDEEMPELGELDRGIKPEPLRLTKPESSKTGGAHFGTVMHKCMQILVSDRANWPENGNGKPNRAEAADYVNILIESRKIQGFFKKDEADYINKDILADFIVSKRAADVKNCIDARCETPFTVLADVGKYIRMSENTSENPIAIQGVIDLYYKTENGIALVDFKTDRTDDAGKYTLTESYKVQLRCYRDALESITGEKVTESVLYFLRTGEEITI